MATKKKSTRKSAPKTNRGSPEAIAKRRAARALNRILSQPEGPTIDKRTERRRKRLLAELSSGKRGKRELKPLEALSHAQELLDIGEKLSSIKKAAGRRYRVAEVTDDVREVADQTQAAYGFDKRVWSLLGIPMSKAKTPAPATKRKAAAKKK